MKQTKTALHHSLIALLLCIVMLISSTFAWFTDSVSSGKNIITVGNLDLEMYWTDDLDSGVWHNVEENGYNTIFSYDNWEPGYTDVKYVKLVNAGSLALNYNLSLTPENGVGKLAEVINVYFAKGGVAVKQRADLTNLRAIGLLDNVLNGGATADGTLLAKDQYSPLHPSGEVIMTVAMNMLTTAGNEYMNEDAGTFSITALATQAPFESDSFGNDYDSNAEYPTVINGTSIKVPVTPVNGKIPAGGVALSKDGVSAFVPEGALVKDGATELEFKVTPLENTTSDITVVNNEILIPVDVHIEGLADNNTVPAIIDLGEVLPKYLNMGNYRLFHVEDGVNNEMTLVADASALTAHNSFTYDPLTGKVVVAMASFSEIALVADTSAKWEGKEDYTWYNAADTALYIANADQLHAFAKIVGGMATGYEIDSFSGKTVTLLSDINLNHGTVLPDEENTTTTIFYPIGYSNKSEFTSGNGVNRPTETKTDVTSEVKVFNGTFDGNGHKIANFYQNTWEMFGDYNSGYPANSNYYKDAMGLFAWVDGTVKNLTVDNFESDGEFTPTGVIAAYAGYNGGATFENIAITNCNPRVYNTGNGGIVGIGGNKEKENTISFKNITIDNTNKITALWGSWDVACGGLMGMFRGKDSDNAVVTMNNCHVAAQIDVYNDVCGNYQYYWYRYSGMMVGTNYNMTTDENGYTVPNTKQYSAENCTVHFGDWNDYYYCELVANSLASYTHDHQFSRLTQIQNVSEIQDENGAWNTTGNFILMNGKTPTETCYHIMKDAEGNLYEHKHNVKDDTNKDIYETTDINGDGVVDSTVLKENNQRVHLPFNQLFTGYGWGVKHIPVYNGENYAFKGITILDREVADSVEKFETKFTGDFLYRVGNQNTISIGSLFKAKDNATITNDGVWVSLNKVIEDNNISGTFTPSTTSNWEDGTIKFTGTGIAKITIQDYNYCTPTELIVEVVDATNATSAKSATSNNVVLLNDCGFSSLTVSNGYALYGNGFTMTCGNDTPSLSFGEFVKLENGTLDNVQVICPNYDYAALYNSQLTSDDNRSQTTDKTRYYNAKSAVNVSGNSQILNSRISGGRAAVNVSGGNVVIDNSRVELGAVASLLIGSANSLTLRDVTLIQKPTASTYDSNKTLMGFSTLFICDADGNTAPVTLEGTLVQNAWVDENDKQYVPSAGQSIISTVLEKTEYLHDIDGDGTKESLNLGFAYMPESVTSKVNTTTITDNRTDKDSVPYDYAEISILNGKTYVYSYKNTNGTADSFKTESEYKPNKYSDIITVSYADTTEGLTTGKTFGTDGWVYELNVDLDKLSGYALDFSKLSMSVNGVSVTDFKVDGNAKPTSPVAVAAGGQTYTLTATVNGEEYSATYKVTGTETSKESPSKISGPTAAGFGVAKSYGGDWSGAADVLTGVKVKYWSVTENKYIEFDFSNFTVHGNAGKLNGTNNYWEYTHTNNDFTLKVTNTVAIHSGKSVYGMPIRGTDGKLYFTISSTNGYVGSGTTSRAITMQYEFTDNNGGEKLTFTHTFNISYNKDEQYSYSDLSGSGELIKLDSSDSGSSSGCVTPDTLITLADGSQKRVDSLTGDEMLLVWNLETGKYEAAPIVFVDSEEETEYEIVHLYFSDKSDVKVISEHGFFDIDLGKYVYIDAQNYADYVGHRFVKEGNVAKNNWDVITLDKVVIEKEVTTAWSPVTFEHLCYYTNGVLSMPGGIDGLFNIFDVDTDTMRYDAEKMQKDIETYGLFTVEDFGGLIPEIAFEAFNGDYLKVAIGKGLLTWEDIAALAERYIPLM